MGSGDGRVSGGMICAGVEVWERVSSRASCGCVEGGVVVEGSCCVGEVTV